MAKRLVLLAVVAGAAYAGYYFLGRPPSSLVLTGIVTTHDVAVAPPFVVVDAFLVRQLHLKAGAGLHAPFVGLLAVGKAVDVSAARTPVAGEIGRAHV